MLIDERIKQVLGNRFSKSTKLVTELKKLFQDMYLEEANKAVVRAMNLRDMNWTKELASLCRDKMGVRLNSDNETEDMD